MSLRRHEYFQYQFAATLKAFLSLPPHNVQVVVKANTHVSRPTHSPIKNISISPQDDDDEIRYAAYSQVNGNDDDHGDQDRYHAQLFSPPLDSGFLQVIPKIGLSVGWDLTL